MNVGLVNSSGLYRGIHVAVKELLPRTLCEVA